MYAAVKHIALQEQCRRAREFLNAFEECLDFMSLNAMKCDCEPMFLRRCVSAHHHQNICAVTSHAHLQQFKIKSCTNRVYIFHHMKRITGCASACLRNCVRTKTNICSVWNHLRGNTGGGIQLQTLPVAVEWVKIYCSIGWQLTSDESWNTLRLCTSQALIILVLFTHRQGKAKSLMKMLRLHITVIEPSQYMFYHQ